MGVLTENNNYFYYAHLHSYAHNLKVGDKVYPGQLLGYMGDTGYGEEGTTGKFVVHLHVGIYVRDEYEREVSINPYIFLKSAEN